MNLFSALWLCFALLVAIGKYQHELDLPTCLTGVSLSKRQPDSVPASEDLTDLVQSGQDELYYGPVLVGAKTSKTFTCDFDTGSSDLDIPGPDCTPANGCPEAQNLKYDNSGTSAGNSTSVTYGPGMVTGDNYIDTVCVAGLCAPNTGFVSLNMSSGIDQNPPTCLMGMGFPEIAQSGLPPFFNNLINQGHLDDNSKEFSFCLGRAASNTQGKSKLTLGGRDTNSFKGEVTEVPVTKRGYWKVQVDGMRVNNGTILLPTIAEALSKADGAIDTGTTIILAPYAAAQGIAAAIPGAIPIALPLGLTGGVGNAMILANAVTAYPCNTDATVSMVFNGKPFEINPLDLSFGQLTGSIGQCFTSNGIFSSTILKLLSSLFDGKKGFPYCVASIAGASITGVQPFYVVGDTFLKNWYSIFNQDNPAAPYVGFAEANCQ
ncbi:acid protease [Rhizodiscina lignyota]|uniref:Acid protease n=1 Tax=Rhizodiscina lignyota TaxID=1504668 RepID=A0A9P4I6G2_9PEZI|nr:acid protease [Rhizodiscina lignyota]